MKQNIIIFICIFLTLSSMQCRTTDDPNKRTADYQMLAGEWQSTKIIYPDDLIFKNKSLDKQKDIVKLHFSPDRNFTFSWDETFLSGKYEIKSNELILIGDKEDEATICTFHINENKLILEMNDGFIFELQKE